MSRVYSFLSGYGTNLHFFVKLWAQFVLLFKVMGPVWLVARPVYSFCQVMSPVRSILEVARSVYSSFFEVMGSVFSYWVLHFLYNEPVLFHSRSHMRNTYNGFNIHLTFSTFLPSCISCRSVTPFKNTPTKFNDEEYSRRKIWKMLQKFLTMKNWFSLQIISLKSD